MSSTQPTTTNNEKRTFFKTVLLTFAFFSLGGLGSIIKSHFFGNSETKGAEGFGSKGYGK
jgi:hypothetical protein